MVALPAVLVLLKFMSLLLVIMALPAVLVSRRNAGVAEVGDGGAARRAGAD